MDGGSRVNKNFKNGGFFLRNVVVKKLFDMMENSLACIPTCFDGSFRHPFGKHSTRAVDWIDIARFAIPALFVGKFQDHGARVAMLSIVAFIQTVLHKDLQATQLVNMKRSLEVWTTYLLNQVDEGKLPVSVFTPNEHYLQHIIEIIKRLGPPTYYSPRCMERTIGLYKRRKRSTKDPGVEAGNIMVKLAARNNLTLKNNCEQVDRPDLGNDLTPQTINLISDSLDAPIEISTQLMIDGITYGSTRHRSISGRTQSFAVFKVGIQRSHSIITCHYAGDVLFYFKWEQHFYAVARLVQLTFGSNNLMYCKPHVSDQSRTVILHASTIIGPAGRLHQQELGVDYIFWESMTIGVDTCQEACGSLDGL
ncbi:hypothetical protein [Absidia glauca]|uniref:Uncharacterized protein n=1 Tax=Absidia glauca TaxID=4829 RepID=A0A168N931_ABSGL|nr:hypothetical protein [Absidia glauca]